MAWSALAIAGLLEIVWAIALKYSDGFTRLWPSVVFAIAGFLSFAFLSQALKSIPIGTAYAVWTGIGAVGVALVGMAWLKEPVEPARVICIGLIIAGIAGLKFTTGAGDLA